MPKSVKLETHQGKDFFVCEYSGARLSKARFYPKLKKGDPDHVFYNHNVAVRYYLDKKEKNEITEEQYKEWYKSLLDFLGLKRTDVVLPSPVIDPENPDFSWAGRDKTVAHFQQPATSAEEMKQQMKQNKENKKKEEKKPLPLLGFAYLVKPDDTSFPTTYIDDPVKQIELADFAHATAAEGDFGDDKKEKVRSVTVYHNKEGEENPLLKKIFPNKKFSGPCLVLSKKQLHQKKRKPENSSPEDDCCLKGSKRQKKDE